jgi:hypothetical protein
MTDRLTHALQRHRHLRSETVLCQSDGRPLTQKIVQTLVAKAAEPACRARGASAAPHVLFSPGDAWGAGTGHSGAGRARGSLHDAALHAPYADALENAIRLLEPTPSRVIERERGVAHRYPDIDRRSALSLNRTDQAIT